MINYSKIDEKIRIAVEILNKHGFETWESCQGGNGHCFDLPTVRFWGTEFDLIRAYRLCENYDLRVFQASRVYRTTEISTNDSHECPDNKKVWDIPFNEIQFLPNDLGLITKD